jgi:hypothetical protein
MNECGLCDGTDFELCGGPFSWLAHARITIRVPQFIISPLSFVYGQKGGWGSRMRQADQIGLITTATV